MPATWLTWLAWIALAAGAVSALDILVDIYLRRHRQRMAVMEAVWPINALYLGPLASMAYRRWGRPRSVRWQRERAREGAPEVAFPVSVSLGVGHCGAGCTLGDIVAETAIFFFGWSILGSTLLAEYAGDYALALLLGIAFQYFAIAPMRGLGLREGMLVAAKADVLSLTAFEVGLFGWMALMSLVFFPDPHLQPDSPVYWFLMQIGMALGFLTAWPVNVWLIRRGVKEQM